MKGGVMGIHDGAIGDELEWCFFIRIALEVCRFGALGT